MELRNLISEAVVYLRESLRLQNENVSDKVKETASQYIHFIDNKVFENNKKAKTSLQNFINEPDSETYKAKLEVRLEVALEDIKQIQKELEDRIIHLKTIKERNAELQLRIDGLILELLDIKDENPDLKDKVNNLITGLKDIKQQSAIITPEAAIEKVDDDIEDSRTTEDAEMEHQLKEMELSHKEPSEFNNIIIVPWDFTQVAEFALAHAVKYAKTVDAEIKLLHIVKREKDATTAEQRLEKIAKETTEKENIPVTAMIEEGSIFSTISSAAHDLDAKLVIMGTHGVKGMQKLTGSWALKVIADTEAPFIVVQAPPKTDEVKHIVFPVDHTRETRQKLNQARFLSKYFNDLTFHICKPSNISNKDISKKFNNNLNFMRSFFVQAGIRFEINQIEDTRNAADAIIKFVKESNPDLIMISITKDIGIQDYILGADEQKIIANNEKIPVMCINPPGGGRYSYSSGTSG